MPGYKDEKRFSGSLDLDSDYRYIAQGDYVDAENIIDGPGNMGSKTNLQGFTEVLATLDSGQNKVIGTLEDIKRQAIIYFVWNAQGNHAIMHFMIKTRTIEPILQRKDSIPFVTDFLAFTEQNKIHSSNIVDDILTWTDDNVSPRKINIKRAKDFMNQLTPSFINTPYSNLIATGSLDQKLQFIESIKYAPTVKPVVELGNDPDRKTNYLKEKMVQFRYRWVYDDKEKSTWSTGSYITLPDGEENVLGSFNDPSANNYVDVTVQTGHPTVTEIDIAVRFGNLGAWYRLDTGILKYDKDNQQLIPDYQSYIFRFYNDRVLIVLDDTDSLTNYSAIPLLAKTQEIIDGNRLLYANYVEGFDNPTIDVSTTYRMTGVTVQGESPWGGDRTATTNKFSICPINDDLTAYVAGSKFANNPLAGGVDWYDQVLLIPTDPSLLQVGTVIRFHIDYRSHVGTPLPYTPPYSAILKEFTIQYAVTETDLLSWPTNLQNSLKNTIVAAGGDGARIIFWDEDYDGTPYHSMIIENYVTIADTPFAARFTDVDVINPGNRVPTFKKGAFHKPAIVYYDGANRDGGVLTNPSMAVYVPYLPEIAAPPAEYSKFIGDKAIIQLTIRHRPPIWASHYQIVYAGSNLSKYTQFIIKGNPTTNSAGNIDIDTTYIVDYITTGVPNTSLDFQFEVGDRLRFIANSQDVAYEYVETKVLAYDAGTKKLTVTPFDQSLIISQMSGTPTFEQTLCELFRIDAQTENEIYYEIGEQRAILEAGTNDRRHAGDLSNQSPDLTIPAVVELRRGDSYLLKRYFSNNTIGFIVESEDFSDFYDSANIDISRIQAVTNSVRRRYEQNRRYGGRYFSGTNTNDMLFFEGDKYDSLLAAYGPINRVITVGFVLKCIQSKKLTSTYINRNMIFSANGEQQITLTDTVLSTNDPSETGYGTEHPESVVRDDRIIFFYDVNNSCMVQDDANGPASISQYMANTFFYNKTKEINASAFKEFVFCFTAIDKLNNLLIVTFKDESGEFIVPERTICYHIIQNRWKSFYSFTPEIYGSNGTTLVSFRDAQLWIHHDATLRNRFYDTQYPMKVKFVSNIDPAKKKVFDAIAINSNKSWASPDLEDISIPACDQYPQGMNSRLIQSKFRSMEGIFYADYMRDSNTPNQPSPDVALIEGRPLRGEVLVQEIQNSHSAEVVLFEVIIHSTPSEKSK